MTPPPPDAFKLFQAALADLNTTIGTQLLPVFTPLVQKLGEIVAKFRELGVAATIAQALKPIGETLLVLLNTFIALPAPVQGLIVQVGVLAGAFALIAAPLGFVITGIGSFLSAIGAVIPLVTGFGATIAGWAGAIGPVVAALGTLGKILLGVFTGPVGWVALAVAAGAAIYAFRDQIGKSFQIIGQMLTQGGIAFKTGFVDPVVQGFTAIVQFVNSNFVQPISSAISGLVQAIGSIFRNVTQAITSPFQAAFQTVRGIVNQILNGVGNAVRGVVQAINNIIRGANGALARLKMPQIPYLPSPNIPQFADGGVVTQPTMGLVGEGGEPEYIIPASKMQEAMKRYADGKRGNSVIPSTVSPQVNVTTGPVMSMNGQNYVNQRDLVSGLMSASRSTAESVIDMLRSDMSVRREIGLS
jgi:hypothetical protein